LAFREWYLTWKIQKSLPLACEPPIQKNRSSPTAKVASSSQQVGSTVFLSTPLFLTSGQLRVAFKRQSIEKKEMSQNGKATCGFSEL
jgi:hypothetical protein